MTKVGEHITLDIIGTTKEYDPSIFEKVIHDIAKAAKVTILNISKYKLFFKRHVGLTKSYLCSVVRHLILLDLIPYLYKLDSLLQFAWLCCEQDL